MWNLPSFLPPPTTTTLKQVTIGLAHPECSAVWFHRRFVGHDFDSALPSFPPSSPSPHPPAAPSLRNFVDLDSEGRVKAEERALLDRLQQTRLEGGGRTSDHKTYFM